MLSITLYRMQNSEQCDTLRAQLDALKVTIPHELKEIDIRTNDKLLKEMQAKVPLLVAGPYRMSIPVTDQDLRITLSALLRGQEQDAVIDDKIARGDYDGIASMTRSEQFSLWLSKHYLGLINIFVFLYVGLPFLAPVLMKVGAVTPALVIYKAYTYVCHTFAFRSWFLFGEQSVYPRAAAGLTNLISYGKATGLDELDIIAARNFIGNNQLGYKVALCERDVAIYLSILAFGLIYAAAKRKLPKIHWAIWILLALVPIGLDGVSQLISQIPQNFIAFRESTPFLRALTGGLFGFVSAWFGFPYVEESMVESRVFLERRLKLIQAAQARKKANAEAATSLN